MATNTAAWLNAVGEKLEVRSAPYPSPGENEIVVKNHAWAVNPVDWLLQDKMLFEWMKFPLILGSDVAGEVAEVGSGVTRFKKGDRVMAMALGLDVNSHSAGGFQHYTIIEAAVAAPIPEKMSFADACVIPLTMSTAATGLFQQDFLGLQHPTVPPKPTGKTVIVWGGASAVGSNAIQLAVAGGYAVFTTASPKNFDYVRKLGASKAFDYNSGTVVQDLVAALEDKQFAGLLHAAGDNGPSYQVADKAKGKKFVAAVMQIPENVPSGVDTKFIWGSLLKSNEVGPAIFVDFLPKALREGKYQAMPEAMIVGKGLESIQDGLDAQKKGMSARKVVVTA